MYHRFGNQVALITGAGSGIGRQFALELSRRGAVIAAVDLHAESLQTLMEELKSRNAAGGWEVADVTDRAGLHAAVAALSQRIGPVELLIANAGIGLENPAATFSADIFARQIAVNLQGVANSVEAVLPDMLERGRGHLVAVASLASYRGLPLLAGYSASKAGVVALMDSLRLELRPSGIHCTTICPGWIRTPLTENVRFPKPRMLEVEPAVRRMVDAVEQRKSFMAFPAADRYKLALLRFLPAGVGDWLTRRIVMRRMKLP